MRKQITFILLLALVCVLVACGDKEIDKKEDEMVQVEQSESDVTEESSSLQQDTPAEEPSQQNSDEGATEEAPTSSTGSSDNTNNTQKPSTGNSNTTTKPSAGSTNNSGSTDNSGSAGITGNTQNNNSGTTTKPSTPVHEHKWTEVVEEEIHYYAWRTLCGKCGLDMTDMSADDLGYHTAVVCHSRYSTKYIEVDFATENVVKTPVVTGYKCECGATKKK